MNMVLIRYMHKQPTHRPTVAGAVSAERVVAEWGAILFTGKYYSIKYSTQVMKLH